VLLELHASLKPGGVLFSSNPHGHNEEGWNAAATACVMILILGAAMYRQQGLLSFPTITRPAAGKAALASECLASVKKLRHLPPPDAISDRCRSNRSAVHANCALSHPAISLGQTRRCTRLFQRVRAGEGVDHRERISDPGEIRKWRGVDRKEFCSRGLAREADVGERDRVAVAIAAGGSVFQVRFERGQRGRVPMLAPFDAGWLIELEFVFQIFAHARHDQRV
jgi:hypothetical protein